MSSDKRTAKSESAEDAAHPGQAARDQDRPAPGSGLERRQERNSAHTETSQANPEEDQPAPDPKTR